jgi:predicted  nucleic acid-binding Zn-ribbon protein
MEDVKYVECQNCGTIHYVVSEEEAKTLTESGALFDEFSNRNLECCVNCGSKNRFLNVSETYANEYLHDDKIPPILLKNEESKGITESQPK